MVVLSLPNAFPNIATFFILEHSLLHSPLRMRTLLHLLFPLLVVNLLPMLCLASLVTFVYLFMIGQWQTKKSAAVPHNLLALLSNENPPQPSLPDSKPSQSNVIFVPALEDPTPSSQRRSSAVLLSVHCAKMDGESRYPMRNGVGIRHCHDRTHARSWNVVGMVRDR